MYDDNIPTCSIPGRVYVSEAAVKKLAIRRTDAAKQDSNDMQAWTMGVDPILLYCWLLLMDNRVGLYIGACL